jgi:PAS domain S-box-containing protein
MSHSSQAGLAGWNVEAQPFLKAILDCVAQPVWVVDHDGLIRFANPAALAALGYDDLAQLEGRPSHETIHYRHPDGSYYPAEECPLLRPRSTGETVHGELDWFFRRDGTMFPVSYWSAPIDTPTGRGAVLAFTNIEEQRAAERAERERDIAQAREADARAAQRRVIEAGDAARRQVTRDLHDGAQHKLVNVVINLQLTRDMWDSDPGQARALLDTTADQARAAIDDLRELSAGMHPTLLTTHGLFAAVEALSDRLPLPIAIDVCETRFSPAIEASVYFFISEALTNVVKHAQATRAHVRVAASAGVLIVELGDDGIGGVDPGAPIHGVASLADRVTALSGDLEIRSPRGGGTMVRAEIPLPSEVGS